MSKLLAHFLMGYGGLKQRLSPNTNYMLINTSVIIIIHSISRLAWVTNMEFRLPFDVRPMAQSIGANYLLDIILLRPSWGISPIMILHDISHRISLSDS